MNSVVRSGGHARAGRWWRSLMVAAAAGVLAACGGGGGGSTPPAGTQHTLGVSVSGNGSVGSQPSGIQCGATCSASYNAGTQVTLTATPAAGQVFGGWGGECAGSTATCTVTMSAARTVTARFDPPAAARAALNVSVSGGGVLRSQPAGIDCGNTCSAEFAINTSVVLSATPAAGQVFAAWGGACTGAGLTCTVTMSAARSASASFTQAPAVQRTLTVTRGGTAGTVRSLPAGIDCGSTCAATFGDGANVVLTAEPGAGQRFGGWTGACSGTTATCTLAMSQDRSVGATFAAAPAAPVWGTAQLLEASNDFNVNEDRVLTATSASGHAVVLWEQSDGAPDGDTRKVFARRYVPGQGWEAAVAVPGVSTSSSSTPLVEGRLLIDGSGTATWLRPNLETRRFTGRAWSNPFVPPARSGGLLSAAVVDANGNIGVLISGDDVYNNALSAGSNNWGTWARVDASGTLAARDADVALSSNGTAMAIWRERNPGDNLYSIKAARYLPQGGWQAPQTIDTSFDNVSIETPPRVVLDAAGNAIAVWHQGDSMYYNVFAAAAGWGTATEFDARAVSASFPARIRLAITPAGRAVVTWNSGIFALKTMQYAPGTGFSAPVQVAPYAADPQLGMDADGNAVVVYVAPDRWPSPSTGSDVLSRRLAWGGSWSDAVAIEPIDGLGADLFASFSSAGQGVAAWVRGDVAGSSARRSLWVNLLR